MVEVAPALMERIAFFVVPARVAVIIIHPLTTVLVLYGKTALIAPVAMLTDAGTCNPAFEDLRATTSVVAAALEMLTVHEPEAPGWMEVGEQVKDVSAGLLVPTREMVVFALLVP